MTEETTGLGRLRDKGRGTGATREACCRMGENMKANYHTHTWRCMHATGTEREYVENAIEGGLKILGFSDHTPYPYPEDFTSGMRMGVNQLESYVDTVLALKAEYRDDIEIHLGLEVEYQRAYFAKLQRIVAEYPIEYFLLAQHFIDCEIDGAWSGRATDDVRILRAYCEQTSEAMETGYFTYFAHPDLIRFTGDDGIYADQMRKLCRKAKSLRIPIEVNFLGIYEERWYPNERFWKIAGEEGCEVVFGVDAHTPDALNRPEILQTAQNLAERYGLMVQETVAFKAPV